MNYADLSTLLHRRLEIIADHAWRARDPEGQLMALREISTAIERWNKTHEAELPSRLRHFLDQCSYEKALRFAESDGKDNRH